jgi:hypothetical protein
VSVAAYRLLLSAPCWDRVGLAVVNVVLLVLPVLPAAHGERVVRGRVFGSCTLCINSPISAFWSRAHRVALIVADRNVPLTVL